MTVKPTSVDGGSDTVLEFNGLQDYYGFMQTESHRQGGLEQDAIVRDWKRPRQCLDYQERFATQTEAALVIDNGSFHCRIG